MSAALGFARYFFIFLPWVILLGKGVASNCVCEMQRDDACYPPGAIDQSSEYCAKDDPELKKLRERRPKIMVVLTVFNDYCAVAHYEFFPPGQTIDKEYFLSF